MKLLLIIGPPAVGKATVGKAIAHLTGMKLFHNHHSIEAVLPVFDYGTPQFQRLVELIREETFREAAASDIPGLIFTCALAFDDPEDLPWLQQKAAIFKDRGHPTYLVELEAPLATRLERNVLPDRLREKPSKRDKDSSRRVLLSDERHRMNSHEGEIDWENYLRLDNGELTAQEAARRVVSAFGW